MDLNCKELIETGVKRNCLVYDGDAVCGGISKRIFALMLSVARKEGLEPVKFYVEGGDEELLLLQCYSNPCNVPRVEKMFGYPISFIDMEPCLKYFRDLGGALQANDMELIFLECTDSGLVGSY